MYWVDNPIWAGPTLSITAMAAFSTFFVNLSLSLGYVFGLVFIWGIASVIMALKFGKWVATIGAAIRILLIAFFTLTVLIYAGQHGLHGFGGGAFKPTWLVFLAAAPILIFNLEGFELPSAASEEMVNPKRTSPSPCCAPGSAPAVLRHPRPGDPAGAPAVPAVQRGGIPRRAATGLRRLRGPLTSSGAVLTGSKGGSRRHRGDRGDPRVALLGRDWLIGSDRAQAVAGYDGAAPRAFGYFSKRLGTPIVVNLVSGVVSTIVLVSP
jgi:amino acid transporter